MNSDVSRIVIEAASRGDRWKKPTLTPALLKRPLLRPLITGLGVALGFLLSGCALATLPVKAVSKTVDWTTTSQDEADRNRGREARKRDSAYGKCVRRHLSDC